MRKFFLLLVLSAAVPLMGACQKELTYNRKDIQPRLNLNAQLKVGDTLHIVHLCLSTDKTILPVQSGSVRCVVNGKLAATAIEVDGDKFVLPLIGSFYWSTTSYSPGKMRQKSFAFKADLQAGDKVRIEAEADGHSAWAEVIVPKAPEFEIADTTSSFDPNDYYEGGGQKFFRQTVKFHLKGSDNVPGANYYRLWGTLLADDLIYLRKKDPQEPGEETPEEPDQVLTGRATYEKGIHLQWRNDPILNDGAPAEDLDMFGAGENIYNAFSDNLFSDSSFDLNFEIWREQLQHIDDRILWREENGSVELQPVDSVYAQNTLAVCLSAISEQQYHLLKSLNIKANGPDEGMIFTEPVTFPDNVVGGVGLVSIENPAVRKLPLPGFLRKFNFYMETD